MVIVLVSKVFAMLICSVPLSTFLVSVSYIYCSFLMHLGFNISYPRCRAKEPWRIGDGVCDDEYNSADCRFDGGDCS
jgi:hypothetical protein